MSVIKDGRPFALAVIDHIMAIEILPSIRYM